MPLARFDEYAPVGLEPPDSIATRPRIAQSLDMYQEEREDDAVSTRSTKSTVPLAPSYSYPPSPSHNMPQGPSSRLLGGHGDQLPPTYDAERMAGFERLPNDSKRTGSTSTNSRTSSWDLLSGFKKFEQDYEHFDSRNVSSAHLAFADGDVPKNKASRLYHYLLNVSIVTRWILFIVPVLSILWIPGILALTKFHDAHVWGVGLLWWSIWLTVAWVGWWGALAVSRVIPHVLRATVGIVAVDTRRYIDWLVGLSRYIALFIWAMVNFISYNPLIATKQDHGIGGNSPKIIALVQKLLFGIFMCAAVLLAEKFAIQWIATKFHEQSYADRILAQKFAVKVLVTLYRHSSDIPGRSDTFIASHAAEKRQSRYFIKQALKGVKIAATTTTTAFGNVASEIAGSSLLQPNSPAAMVQTAMESANQSRKLARRLYYSFADPSKKHLYVENIANFFSSPEEADAAYALFDKDGNGDVSRDEMEMTLMQLHREQLSIEHSLQDMDSAVGKLDGLFMCLYFIVALLILAVSLEAQLSTLITGTGTYILGLSWLIGGSLQEVLTSIIFLFIKHPFDVGDRVNILTASYTVKEINLLSTVFIDSSGCSVQAPNIVLNTTYIQNMRRSSQMSESFPFGVSYSTTFEQLEALRETMIVFLLKERRDFQPSFDVTVLDFPDQSQLSLTVDIKYKSNWQQAALKSKRRNKWICALKAALAEVKIFGPKGDPSSVPAPVRQTLVPWEEVQENEHAAMRAVAKAPADTKMPAEGWKLSDNSTIMGVSEDPFQESDEPNVPNSRRGMPAGLRQRPSATPSQSAMNQSFTAEEENIEMTPSVKPAA